jgi:integrase/recombinase XerD
MKINETSNEHTKANSTYLELLDITDLEEATTCMRDRLLIRMLFHLGCRISEILSLHIEDIDLMAGTVTIVHLKLRMKLLCPNCQARIGKAHRFCPICGSNIDTVTIREQQHKRMRKLPLDKDTVAMLRDYINRGGPIFKNGEKLIFGINRHRAWQIVTDCAEGAGLPSLINPESGKVHHVSPHKLRDAFAVHAMKLNDSGDGLRLLQEHLGHASFNTTARYRKVAGEEHRQWYDSLWKNNSNGGTS